MTLCRRIVQNSWRFREPFSNARHTWRERESIELHLEDANGVFVGEAAPLPGFSRETLAEARSALESVPLEHLARVVERCSRDAGPVLGALAPLASVEVPSARFALESALLALIATRRRESLAQLLFGKTEETACNGRPLAQLVDIAGAEEHAATVLADGYTTLKLKLNISLGFERELDTLVRLRSRFGSAFRLRLDANGSFTRDRARECLQALAVIQPEFVEEPLPPREPLLAQTLVPIALDESLSAPSALAPAELLRSNVRVLVLKPTVLGGVSATLAFIERARTLNIDWVLSHTFEGDVGYRALTALALALPEARLAHGLGPHAALRESAEALGVRGGRVWAAP